MEECIIHINSREKTEAVQAVEAAIAAFKAESEWEKVIAVLEEIRVAITKGDRFVIPIEIPEDLAQKVIDSSVRVGDSFEYEDDLRVCVRQVDLKDGTVAYAAFTCEDELPAEYPTSTLTEKIDIFLEKVLMSQSVDGVLLNPWGESFYLSKDFIRRIFEGNLPAERKNIIGFDTVDITKLDIECIVNAANSSLFGGGGVDGAVHRAAGPQLLEECRALNGCATGEAKITKGYNLQAQYIIHTVGPRYSGKPEDAKLLRNCYWNSLELAKANDIHSIAFPAISTGVYHYPLQQAAEIALKTVSDWLKINPRYGMAVMFACFNEKVTDLYREMWASNEASWNERPIIRENNGTLERAMQFAMAAHKGQSRKGTDTPYILHPIETLQILASMEADTNLMAAGLLHDTLEDTKATLLDIYENFGVDIAALVNGHTEDKRQIWYMRKLLTVTELPHENIRAKMLAMADKVANLRSLYRDYKQVGEELWKRFNAPKHMQAWYYSRLNDGFEELQNYTQTEGVYWEMTGLFKDLFVSYYVDDDKGVLYQVCEDGSIHSLKKGKPQWNTDSKKVSRNARAISRKEGERIEDNWAEPFWAVHELDLSDASLEVFRSETVFTFVEIKNGEILFREDLTGADGEQLPEIAYSLDSDNSHRLLVQLRLKYGTRYKLSTVFKNEFGYEDSVAKFISFCEEHRITFLVLGR